MKMWTHGAAAFSAMTMIALVGCGSSSSGSSTTTSDGGASASSGSQSTSTQSGPSSGSGGNGTGGSAACGIFWDTTAGREDCETCMETSCCSQLEACAPGSDCDALLSCITACKDGDSACEQTCVSGHAQGVSDYQAINTCYQGNCYGASKACAYPVCDMSAVADQDCATCVSADPNCCTDIAACAKDTTCVACTMDSTGADCASNAAFTAYNKCFDTSCGKTCEGTICGSTLGYTGFPACNYCLSQSCCTQFNDCEGDADCSACLTSSSGTGCDTNTKFKAFTDCRDTGACKTDCGGG